MASGWAKLGIAIGGALLGGWLLGPMIGAWGMSVGFLAGSYLGNMIFPTDYESHMPPIHDYPVQSSAVGVPINIILGTGRTAGNIIWMSDLQPYVIEHKASGGKGGGDEASSYETRYRRSFLISICEGPGTILRCWKGKEEISLTKFTSYNGVENSGISTLLGEDYAEYKNLVLAYFQSYELGNSQALPNFIFEVASGVVPTKTIFVGGNTDSGNHLWAIGDDGTTLSLEASYAMPGDVKQIRYSDYNDRLYVIIGNSVYCYKPGDMTLDTSYGTSGIVTFDTACYRLKVDSSGYAAVVATDGATDLTLLDSVGTKVWQVNSGSSPYEADFDKDGNILVSFEGSDGGRVAKFARSNGAFVEQIQAKQGPPNIFACRSMVADKTRDWCWFDWGATTFYVTGHKRNGSWAQQWLTSIGTDSAYKDSLHIASLGKLVVPISGNLTIRDADTGANVVQSASVSPNAIDINSDDELCTSHNSGIVRVFNISMVQQRTIDIGNSNLVGCAVREIALPTAAFDMNFATMIKELLTNTKMGGYSESDLITEDFDNVTAYCNTNNLKGSIIIKEQKPLPDWIAYICSHFQGYFYEIGGKIGLNCYRDESSVLSITQDDLVREGDEPPVHTTKRQYNTTYNRLEATWTNRSGGYKTGVVPAFDRIDQRESSQVRTKTMDLRCITNVTLASKMAWRIFIDQIYRFSQYSFKLGYKSMLLEVGDVIDVTDGHLLVSKKMRVMNITEEKDGRTALISANEDISDLYPSLSYTIQENDAAADPTITLNDGTIAFRENWNNNKLHLSVTPGGAQCNGWYLYRSYDNASYDLFGKRGISGVTGGEANSTGTLQNCYLPAHTAVIHRENEWFNVDIGTVTDLDTSITDDDFFNNRKLAKIGDEIIAYKTCVESSVEGVWRVSNVIRGLFGTRPVAHSSGETFYTLDIDFYYDLQDIDIGKTLYFKIVSFYGTDIQLVSDVSAYSHQIKGLWKRPAAASLLRLTSDENGRSGVQYTGSSFTLYWTLPGQKGTGFNQGGFDLNTTYPTFRYGDSESELVGGNGVQFGSYLADPDLQGVDLVFEKTDGTFISQRSVGPTVTSAVIDKSTDLGNNATAVIKVYPRRAQRSEKAEPITVTGA